MPPRQGFSGHIPHFMMTSAAASRRKPLLDLTRDDPHNPQPAPLNEAEPERVDSPDSQTEAKQPPVTGEPPKTPVQHLPVRLPDNLPDPLPARLSTQYKSRLGVITWNCDATRGNKIISRIKLKSGNQYRLVHTQNRTNHTNGYIYHDDGEYVPLSLSFSIDYSPPDRRNAITIIRVGSSAADIVNGKIHRIHQTTHSPDIPELRDATNVNEYILTVLTAIGHNDLYWRRTPSAQ